MHNMTFGVSVHKWCHNSPLSTSPLMSGECNISQTRTVHTSNIIFNWCHSNSRYHINQISDIFKYYEKFVQSETFWAMDKLQVSYLVIYLRLKDYGWLGNVCLPPHFKSCDKFCQIVESPGGRFLSNWSIFLKPWTSLCGLTQNSN